MTKIYNNKLSYLKVLFLCSILFTVMFTGCVEEEQKPGEKELSAPEIQLDQPSILPNWKDGEYHDYYETTDILSDFKVKYPDLVNVFSIGKSVLGKDIWCIRITNENNNQAKFSCLVDGCIHGCEWEAGEACLYLADYLLINFRKNATVTNILNISEIFIVPLLNPDGRQKDERWNDNGIDLNRNFDVHFGRILGRSFPLGKLFGKIKISGFRIPKIGIFTNAGRRPFSEPETQAIGDLMKSLYNRDFSFYVNCHTALRKLAGPSTVTFRSQFEMTKKEKNVIDYATKWAEENTEYGVYDNIGGFGSGNAPDWCFKEFRVPSFTYEILSIDYEPWFGGGRHDHLVHWMKTTLPVFMYLLVNINNLHQWKTPDIQPPLPEGVPPPPLH